MAIEKISDPALRSRTRATMTSPRGRMIIRPPLPRHSGSTNPQPGASRAVCRNPLPKRSLHANPVPLLSHPCPCRLVANGHDGFRQTSRRGTASAWGAGMTQREGYRAFPLPLRIPAASSHTGQASPRAYPPPSSFRLPELATGASREVCRNPLPKRSLHP